MRKWELDLVKQESISEVKEKLATLQDVTDPYVAALRLDERAGIQKLLASFDKRFAKIEALKEKYQAMLRFETPLLAQGHRFIAGIDEVGRGPLAGPVVACAVILSPENPVYGLDDSKKLSAKKRGELFLEIRDKAVTIGVGVVNHDEIDRLNIYQASRQAMLMAVNDLAVPPSYLLLDAMLIDSPLPQEKIIKGDAQSVSIAAASIVAKEMRDDLMRECHQLYPHYGFDKNAGYGTKEHLAGLEKYGPCEIHRRSFRPVSEYFK